ncbi:MAG: hypothetical protein J5742_00795 [Alphaproteobacteria bacterium]|nr:hypothetical protein [Alphaproteobacteria bacterium]
MKKIALASLLSVLVVSGANATTNYFVGGGFDLSTTDTDETTILRISPLFGWKLNSNWDMGVVANFGYDETYFPRNHAVSGNVYKYGADVFARYKVAQMGGIKLLLMSSVGADFSTYVSDDFPAMDGETLTSLSASIVPMVTYDITESFTLYARLNFLGLYADYQFKNEDMGVMDNSWFFTVFANSSDVANTGEFQIGFLYNF